MNEEEKDNINTSNSFSDEDKVCLENIKNKMDKTEKQINEIVEQIQNLTETVHIIQEKVDKKPDLNSNLYINNVQKDVENSFNILQGNDILQEKEDKKIEKIETLKEIKATPVKKKAKRYKEKTKGEKTKNKGEYKNQNDKKNKLTIVGEFVFYLVLLVIILGAFLLRSNSNGQPTSFAGYSIFTVLTGSMESEIPKGSIVVTKQVNVKELQIGDDITFMANKTTTITHRIIAILESYQDTGQRAFQTQGIMNAEPDKNMVPAVNVIGKVIWHSKLLGEIANYLQQNLILLIFVVVVLVVFINVMKKIYKQDEVKENKKQKK